jgi:hypothetical protein
MFSAAVFAAMPFPIIRYVVIGTPFRVCSIFKINHRERGVYEFGVEEFRS